MTRAEPPCASEVFLLLDQFAIGATVALVGDAPDPASRCPLRGRVPPGVVLGARFHVFHLLHSIEPRTLCPTRAGYSTAWLLESGENNHSRVRRK